MPELQFCPECHLFFEQGKEKCPHCGHPAGKPDVPVTVRPGLEPPAALPPHRHDPAPRQLRSMSFVAKVTGLLFRPTETFRALEDESPGAAYIHFLISLAVFSITFTALFFVVLGSMMTAEGTSGFSGTSSNPVGFCGSLFLAGAVFCLFIGAFFHLFVYLAGGRQGIGKTVRVILYAAMPNLLFGWIPGIGLIFSIWSVVLHVIGIRELQKISTGRAVLAITGSVIGFLLVIVLFVVVIVGIGAGLSAVAGPALMSAGATGPEAAADAAFYSACMMPDPAIKARVVAIAKEYEIANATANYAAIPPLMDENAAIISGVEQKLAAMPVSGRMADIKTLCILSQQDASTAMKLRAGYARSMQQGDLPGAEQDSLRSLGYSFASSFDDELITILHNDTHRDGGGPEDRTMTFVANYHNYIEVSRFIAMYGDAAVSTRNWQFAQLIANRTHLVSDHYDRIFTEYQVAQPFVPYRTEVMGMVEDQRAYADALKQGADLAMKGDPQSSVYFQRATTAELSAQNHSQKAYALYPLPQST
jgi:hypothetical protein